jgi:hypothetical protein
VAVASAMIRLPDSIEDSTENSIEKLHTCITVIAVKILNVHSNKQNPKKLFLFEIRIFDFLF